MLLHRAGTIREKTQISFIRWHNLIVETSILLKLIGWAMIVSQITWFYAVKSYITDNSNLNCIKEPTGSQYSSWSSGVILAYLKSPHHSTNLEVHAVYWHMLRTLFRPWVLFNIEYFRSDFLLDVSLIISIF